MRRYLLLSVVMVVFASCTSYNGKGKSETTQTIQKETIIVRDTVYISAESKGQSNPDKIKEASKYLLVGGCFEYKQNADRMRDEMQKEGYKNALIMPYGQCYYLVAYDGYPTRSEAVVALREIHRVSGKEETWIYRIK